MNLKEKIVELLSEKGYAYADLCNYLEVSEKELDEAINKQVTDSRTVELIAKALRVSLYTLWNTNENDINYTKKAVSLPHKEIMTLKEQLALLKSENENLKSDLTKKEELISNLLGKK